VSNWAAASCGQVQACWKVDEWSAPLARCEGLGPEACDHIKSCSGGLRSN
jgi:hypothetical protein